MDSEDCLKNGIDLPLSSKGMTCSKVEGERLEIRFPNGPVNLVFHPSFHEDQEGVFSWSFELTGNIFVTIGILPEADLRNSYFEASSFGFKTDTLGLGNQKLVSFPLSFGGKLLLTMTIDFNHKQLILERIDLKIEGDQPSFYNVDLSNLQKNSSWPIRVGITGYANTTITMESGEGAQIKPAKRT